MLDIRIYLFVLHSPYQILCLVNITKWIDICANIDMQRLVTSNRKAHLTAPCHRRCSIVLFWVACSPALKCSQNDLFCDTKISKFQKSHIDWFRGSPFLFCEWNKIIHPSRNLTLKANNSTAIFSFFLKNENVFPLSFTFCRCIRISGWNKDFYKRPNLCLKPSWIGQVKLKNGINPMKLPEINF